MADIAMKYELVNPQVFLKDLLEQVKKKNTSSEAEAVGANEGEAESKKANQIEGTEIIKKLHELYKTIFLGTGAGVVGGAGVGMIPAETPLILDSERPL